MFHGICSFGPRSSIQIGAALHVKRLLISPVTAEVDGRKCSSGSRILARDLQSPLRNVVVQSLCERSARPSGKCSFDSRILAREPLGKSSMSSEYERRNCNIF